MDTLVKQYVGELLRKRAFGQLLELCEKNRKYWQEVRFRLYDIDERLRWPAIETVALFMQRWWQAGKEDKVRQYIRTLFWSMTDESGGIGWSSPQAVAEIIVHIPEIIDPYGSMMIAYSIEEPPLVNGGLWGIGRLGERITGAVDFFRDKVLAVFEINDIETLGLASWSMGEIRFKPALPFLEKLLFQEDTARMYLEGDFHEKPLGLWAKEAICKIEKSL
jgi:hypothetical protein